MNKTEARRKIEELIGRLDVVQAEIRRAQEAVVKYTSLNEVVQAREAQQEVERLTQRRQVLEIELRTLQKYW